ncbi:MAG: hypothetical protein RR219_07070 [Clostridiales bacterium]
MSFFDDFTKSASNFAVKAAKSAESAFKVAVNKGSEFAEVSKLKMKISAEDKSIEDLYYKIGKSIYEDCVETGIVPEIIQEECSSVYEHKSRISELQGKIELIRGQNGYTEEEASVDVDFDESKEVVIEDMVAVKDEKDEVQYGVIHDIIADKTDKTQGTEDNNTK